MYQKMHQEEKMYGPLTGAEYNTLERAMFEPTLLGKKVNWDKALANIQDKKMQNLAKEYYEQMGLHSFQAFLINLDTLEKTLEKQGLQSALRFWYAFLQVWLIPKYSDTLLISYHSQLMRSNRKNDKSLNDIFEQEIRKRFPDQEQTQSFFDTVSKLYQGGDNLLEAIHLLILIRFEHEDNQAPFPKHSYNIIFKILNHFLKNVDTLPESFYTWIDTLKDDISDLDLPMFLNYYANSMNTWKRKYQSLMRKLESQKEKVLSRKSDIHNLDHRSQGIVEDFLRDTETIRQQLELRYTFYDMENVD